MYISSHIHYDGPAGGSEREGEQAVRDFGRRSVAHRQDEPPD